MPTSFLPLFYRCPECPDSSDSGLIGEDEFKIGWDCGHIEDVLLCQVNIAREDVFPRFLADGFGDPVDGFGEDGIVTNCFL